jgi:hypothetical protein
MRKTLWILFVVLMVAGIIYFMFNISNRASQTPNPSGMPPVVSESMDGLLQSLESELAKHHREVIQSLLPGIIPQELEQAEVALGQ